MLRFREYDIKKLASIQIMTPKYELFEEAAKEYTAFAARMVMRKMWAGALAPGEVRLVIRNKRPQA